MTSPYFLGLITLGVVVAVIAYQNQSNEQPSADKLLTAKRTEQPADPLAVEPTVVPSSFYEHHTQGHEDSIIVGQQRVGQKKVLVEMFGGDKAIFYTEGDPILHTHA